MGKAKECTVVARLPSPFSISFFGIELFDILSSHNAWYAGRDIILKRSLRRTMGHPVCKLGLSRAPMTSAGCSDSVSIRLCQRGPDPNHSAGTLPIIAGSTIKCIHINIKTIKKNKCFKGNET